MGFKNTYELDQDAVENGVEVPLRDGTIIKVRSIRSEAAQRKLKEVQRPYARLLQMQNWTYTPAQQKQINIRLCAEALLVGWRDMKDEVPGEFDESGEPVMAETPYSRQTALDLLTQHEVFREEVLAAAGLDETFRKAGLEAIKGN